MSEVKELIIILISSSLVSNVVLSQFLGLCPFLGVSKKTNTAAGMGVAVIFVITLSSAVTSLIYSFVLVPLNVTYLQTIAFILVIAVLVQIVEIALKKISRSLYEALGVYLPLITTNCAVLGMALLNTREGYNLIQSVVNGVGSALGFTLAIVLFASIRERMSTSNMPKWMDGFPGALIAAGLMSLAFQGFSGLI